MQPLRRLHLVGRHRGTRRPARLQRLDDRFHQRHQRDALLVSAAGTFLCSNQSLLQAVEIGQHQLGLHHLRIADRVDGAFDMRDIVILEAAQHVDDRIHLADVGEELVAQALALAGAAHQAGDIHEFQ